MSWIARKERIFASDCHWSLAMRLGATTMLCAVTLCMGLGLITGCATRPTTPPPTETLPTANVAVDEVAVVLHFANHIRTLSKAERRVLTQRWEKRLVNRGTQEGEELHLALLLVTPGGGKPVDVARARELLEAYVADDQVKSEALLEFARFQLGWLDEQQRWIKAARYERRMRVGLEKKLEALKAIELRMTGQSSKDKVPIR